MTVDLALVTEVDAENPVLGDLRVSGGRVELVEGAEATEQEVRCRLRWWRGEWFLDLEDGTPYIGQLLGKGVSDETIRTMLRREILKVPDVERVESVEVDTDRATRYSQVSANVITTDGELLELEDVPVGAPIVQNGGG